jgi:DNA-binding NarL/FixJ family response regulator
MEMLVAGRSHKEIGVALGITPRTVRMYVVKLMHKVGVQNRIALSVDAITNFMLLKSPTK